MSPPKRIDLTPEQLDALLKRVETGTLQDGDYEIIKGMADTLSFLSQAHIQGSYGETSALSRVRYRILMM